MKIAFTFLLTALFLIAGPSAAEIKRPVKPLTTLKKNIAQTWNEPAQYDGYLPLITWHARFAYDKEKTDKYNERPWGAGFGQARWDEKGNWHGLYAMAFKDSFNDWEPIAGYGWEATWRPLSDEKFRLGLGYTVGVTMRENWNYIPVPLALPLASIGDRKSVV